MRQAIGFYLHSIQEVKQRNVESDGEATKVFPLEEWNSVERST